MKILTLNFLNSLFCCRLRILGFVSKLCGRFRFFAETMAAAAATPTGPTHKTVLKKKKIASRH
jgi:hypothetical protein